MAECDKSLGFFGEVKNVVERHCKFRFVNHVSHSVRVYLGGWAPLKIGFRNHVLCSEIKAGCQQECCWCNKNEMSIRTIK